MRARIIGALLALILLTIFAVIVGWFALGGKERARVELVNRLHPVVGETLDIEGISLSPYRIRLQSISMQLSKSIDVSIPEIDVAINFWKLVFGIGDMKGVIREVRIGEPHIWFHSGGDSIKSGEPFQLPAYKPNAIRSLDFLKVVEKVKIEKGTVSVGQAGASWASGLDLDFTVNDSNYARLTLLATLPQFNDAHLRSDFNADLTRGEFQSLLLLEVPSVKDLPVVAGIEDLTIDEGKLNVALEARGSDDLRLNGEIVVSDIRASFGEKVSLIIDNISIDIFGNSLRLAGVAAVNGVPFLLEGSSDDLLGLKWSGAIRSKNVSLEDFDEKLFGLPQVKGVIDLRLSASGQSERAAADFMLSSEKLSVDTFQVRDIQVRLKSDNALVRAEKVSALIMDGRMELQGWIDVKSGDMDFSGSYDRVWSKEVTPEWLRERELGLSAKLTIGRKHGEWTGNGLSQLMSPDGKSLLNMEFRAQNGDYMLHVFSPMSENGKLEFAYSSNKAEPIAINAQHLHSLAQFLITDDVIPEMLRDFDYAIEVSGKTDRLSFRIETLAEDNRSVVVSGIATNTQDKWLINGDLTSDATSGRLLTVNYYGVVDKSRLEIERLSVYDNRNIRVLNGNIGYSFTNKRLDTFSINTNGMQLGNLLHYLVPGSKIEVEGWLDADVQVLNDSLVWSGETRLLYPDGRVLRLGVSGFNKDSIINMGRLSLIDDVTDLVIMEGKGGYDIDKRMFENVMLRWEDFPISRLLAFAAPTIDQKFGGILNGRFEVAGALDDPEIRLDLHVLNGMLYGEKGYWANIRLVTDEGGVHYLRRGDIGKDLAPLFKLTGGWYSDGSGSWFGIEAENVEMDRLFQAFTGETGIISGNGDFSLNLKGKSFPETGQMELSIGPGMLTDLSFDRLQANLRLSDLVGENPLIKIDSIIVDFGDSKASVMGQIPLKGAEPLGITASLKGRLFGLLPRLDKHFFTRPEGYGNVELSLGGTLAQPKIESGKIDIRNGGIRMAEVIRGLEGVSVQIGLDENGQVSIEKFTGRVDDKPFFFSNRQPRTDEGEEAIIVGGLNLGILQFATGGDGIWAVIPDLMLPEWGGYFRFRGVNGQGAFEFKGPAERPSGTGQVALRNATFTFPFLSSGHGKPSPFVKDLLDLLQRMNWDVKIVPERGCRYVREVSGLGDLPGVSRLTHQVGGGVVDVDLKLMLDLRIDDNPQGLMFQGVIQDSLSLSGELTSSQGTVNLLDTKFQINTIKVRFSPPEIEPLLSGSAWTTVYDTLSQRSSEVRLRLHTSTSSIGTSGEEQGQLSDLIITFEDDRGNSQEQILGLLGYTPEQLPGRIGAGQLVQVTPFTRWTRTLERQMERLLGVDRVSLETNVARNLLDRRFYTSLSDTAASGTLSYWSALYGSRVTIGKYISANTYISYTGSLTSEGEIYSTTRMGVVHNWDLLYRLSKISNNLTLNYRYEYDGLINLRSSSVFVRYNYLFDLVSKFTLFRRSVGWR